MAKILFRLRNVPDDEAEEVRALLTEHDFAFYETSPGNWGISMPAIWLRDESQFDEAKQLLETYQRDRALSVRREYELMKASGQVPTMLDRLQENPVQVIGYCAIIMLILYISISVFVRL